MTEANSVWLYSPDSASVPIIIFLWMGDIEAYRYSNPWHPCTHIATCTPSLELSFSISLGFPGSGPRHGNPVVPWPVRRNSSPLQPKWKRITNAQVQPKYKMINMIRKMIQKHLERQPNTKLHGTCCLSMAIPCHTSKWSVAPAPMASPIALPLPLPTTCLPEKQSQDGIVPSWANRICTNACANSLYK